MEKKYKTEKVGNMLRIIALKDFSNVKKGDKGGWIEKEENLSQEGDCWIYDGCVSGNAKIYGDAIVSAMAMVCGNARVFGKACITGLAKVSGNAKVYGDARVSHNAQINGDAEVCGNARIGENAEISGKAKLWSTSNNSITTLVKNSKDYVILGIERKFRVFSSNFKDISTLEDYISIFDESYIKNIKTIRQLYEKEI